MRNPTELMRTILTDKMAQRIIDYVSPIYGNSYVGLWLFQAIGTVLGEIYDLGSALKYETNPATASLLLDYWEAHYGISKDPSLSTEQRRARIITKIKSRGPCNPTILAEAVSVALGGVRVEITENVAPNTFRVSVRKDTDNLTAAMKVIERMKPAHLLYELVVDNTENAADAKAATAIAHSETFTVDFAEPEVGVYVVGETLVTTGGVFQVAGETASTNVAIVNDETLIFGGA